MRLVSGRTRLHKATALAAGAIMTAGLSLVGATPANAAVACDVSYQIANQWDSGFQANITIRNLGDAWTSWDLRFNFTGGQQLQQGWGGRWSQSGTEVQVQNESWNGSVPSGGTVTGLGFLGSWSGSNPVPTSFTVNGVTCGGEGPSTPPTTPPSTPPSTPPTSTPTGTPTTSLPPPPPPGTHVDNPYIGATVYRNPDYVARVEQAAQEIGGTLGAAAARVAQYPTAIWLDRIAAIEGSGGNRGLRDHLDLAASQASEDNPVVVQIVIYDLPNRDCAAAASNGELLISQDGERRYREEYIDPIVSILRDPAYRNLRIVTFVEPDSLPNLVTNLDTPACAEANSTGAYVEGIQYAVNQLTQQDNVYIYLDIAHSGWLGWDNNFNDAVSLYRRTIQGFDGGLQAIDGFVTNTANYTPLEEPFLTNPNLTVGGQQVRSANFYEWNPMFDELDFALAWRNAFASGGSHIGMIIDTSRNGWGGPDRPTSVSSSNDLNTYVNQSRIDRRPHRGGWCNQIGAGIGERPTAAPVSGIDAYVWVKPPGESDGVSQDGIIDPDDPNKRFDAMCDPNGQSHYNSAYPTNAMPDAPHAGRWFQAQFEMLVRNAYPAL